MRLSENQLRDLQEMPGERFTCHDFWCTKGERDFLKRKGLIEYGEWEADRKYWRLTNKGLVISIQIFCH